jgi:ABC-type branched-subunit amino acid transport system ATPase component
MEEKYYDLCRYVYRNRPEEVKKNCSRSFNYFTPLQTLKGKETQTLSGGQKLCSGALQLLLLLFLSSIGIGNR